MQRRQAIAQIEAAADAATMLDLHARLVRSLSQRSAGSRGSLSMPPLAISASLASGR